MNLRLKAIWSLVSDRSASIPHSDVQTYCFLQAVKATAYFLIHICCYRKFEKRAAVEHIKKLRANHTILGHWTTLFSLKTGMRTVMLSVISILPSLSFHLKT